MNPEGAAAMNPLLPQPAAAPAIAAPAAPVEIPAVAADPASRTR